MNKLANLRGIENLNAFYIKIFIDDGRSKLKVSAGIVPKNYNSSFESAAKKFLESFKETGVKRVMIMAVAPVKETQDNLGVMLERLKIDKFPCPCL